MTASSGDAVDDVPVQTVWARLEANSKAILVDVRTRPEWTYVGLPDLAALGRKPVLVEWQTFPDSRINAAFLEQLSAELGRLGAGRETELYFICRSGVRSGLAARAARQAGYQKCHNVAEGFEGPLDPDSHQRGGVGGWKAAGLPWSQT